MKTCKYIQPTRPLVRSILAAAIGAALLGACQWQGGVDQLNDLRGPTRVFTVELREGTNMAAAPSPDGKRIVFSAQGALWIMPSAGGRAVRITDYRLEPTAPVWSPDGRSIAFQNYAPEGNFHIWTIRPDGSGARERRADPLTTANRPGCPTAAAWCFRPTAAWMASTRSGAWTWAGRRPR
ncbi:hypothetical protein [Massilia sp. Dwa41.01b]|uniref:TolB family protein n=1 Tax=Massilia sp. Dwa41.01b TaxID=2709302 RepID=UPI001E4A5807|nr:hypothetical protein [Massilia sp. Dwa41.01b]